MSTLKSQAQSLIAVVDFGYVADKIEIADGVCWDAQIPHVSRCVRTTGENGCGYCVVICIIVLSALYTACQL